MALEPPKPGQVIRYSYLWWNEQRQGHVEGLKDRPCGVVLSRTVEDNNTVVYVLPITHTPPMNAEHGIAIPLAVKKRLGLDAEPSWLITTELNKFVWPGPDIRSADGKLTYGYLPEKLTRQAQADVLKQARNSQLKTVERDE